GAWRGEVRGADRRLAETAAPVTGDRRAYGGSVLPFTSPATHQLDRRGSARRVRLRAGCEHAGGPEGGRDTEGGRDRGRRHASGGGAGARRPLSGPRRTHREPRGPGAERARPEVQGGEPMEVHPETAPADSGGSDPAQATGVCERRRRDL